MVSWGRRGAAARADHPHLHHLIAIGSLNAGRYDEAEASASRVIALRPDIAEAWWVRAMARTQLGQQAQSHDDAAHAVQLEPQDERFVAYLNEIDAWIARQGATQAPGA
jgi:Flp pilus assembly protein TadD